MYERMCNLGKFINGVLLGVGISLLVAPKTGKEMRELVAERFSNLQGNPPENEELKQSVQQTAQRAQQVQQQAASSAQMGSTAQTYPQQTSQSASSVQQARTDVPSTQYGDTRPLRPNQPKRPTP
jgi:gas vesicle protein